MRYFCLEYEEITGLAELEQVVTLTWFIFSCGRRNMTSFSISLTPAIWLLRTVLFFCFFFNADGWTGSSGPMFCFLAWQFSAVKMVERRGKLHSTMWKCRAVSFYEQCRHPRTLPGLHAYPCPSVLRMVDHMFQYKVPSLKKTHNRDMRAP